MADAEAEGTQQLPAEPVETEVIDLDGKSPCPVSKPMCPANRFAGQPCLVYLDASKTWVRKDHVYADINKEYTAIVKTFAEDADPANPIKGHLANDRDAIPTVDLKTFLVRHKTIWYPRLGRATRDAADELKKFEETQEQYHRKREMAMHGRIVKWSQERYDRACDGRTKAALLVKDLKEYTRTRR